MKLTLIIYLLKGFKKLKITNSYNNKLPFHKIAEISVPRSFVFTINIILAERTKPALIGNFVKRSN